MQVMQQSSQPVAYEYFVRQYKRLISGKSDMKFFNKDSLESLRKE